MTQMAQWVIRSCLAASYASLWTLPEGGI